MLCIVTILISNFLRCRHLCCREGIPAKKSKTRNVEELDEGQHPSKKSHIQQKVANATIKPLTGLDLLNKLHDKTSPNNSKIEPNLSKYKYYAPDLEPMAKVTHSFNETMNKTDDSELDVVSLLREARNKSNLSVNQSKVIEIDDNNDVIELSSSSVINNDNVHLKGSVLTYGGNVQKSSDGIFSDSDDGIVVSKSSASRIHQPILHDVNHALHADGQEEYSSQDSLGDLADILGSDVEVV